MLCLTLIKAKRTETARGKDVDSIACFELRKQGGVLTRLNVNIVCFLMCFAISKRFLIRAQGYQNTDAAFLSNKK